MNCAPTRAKKSGLSTLRFIGLIAISIITMEMCARLDDHISYGAHISSNYNFERIFDFDGITVRGIPHAHYAKWRLNSIGMRGPEPQSAHGQTRILIYGASEAFGIYETPGHEFPRELETALNGMQPATQPGRFEVINGGIPGMRIGSGTEYLESLRLLLAPSIVLIYPTPTHYIGLSRPMCGRPKKTVEASLHLPESRLAQKVSERTKAVLPAWAMTLLRRVSIWWEMHRHDALDAVPEVSLGALEADLKCAIRAVQSIGAMPMLFTHANRFGATKRDDDDYWLVGWRRQYPELRERGFVDLEQRANHLIRTVAKMEDVMLLDADLALSGQPDNFADHAHFSDKGAAKMGLFVADQLQHKLYPRTPERASNNADGSAVKVGVVAWMPYRSGRVSGF